MNPKMLKTMRVKKKRPVDPLAPPRPNLLSHEKVLKDQKLTVIQMQYEIGVLKQQVETLTAKLAHQTQYLAQVHAMIRK